MCFFVYYMRLCVFWDVTLCGKLLCLCLCVLCPCCQTSLFLSFYSSTRVCVLVCLSVGSMFFALNYLLYSFFWRFEDVPALVFFTSIYRVSFVIAFLFLLTDVVIFGNTYYKYVFCLWFVSVLFCFICLFAIAYVYTVYMFLLSIHFYKRCIMSFVLFICLRSGPGA